MFKKQIVYFAMVSLKYFFNLDHDVLNQLLIIGLVCLGYCKLIITLFADVVNDTKTRVREIATSFRQHMGQQETSQRLAYQHPHKHNYIRRDIMMWRQR